MTIQIGSTNIARAFRPAPFRSTKPTCSANAFVASLGSSRHVLKKYWVPRFLDHFNALLDGAAVRTLASDHMGPNGNVKADRIGTVDAFAIDEKSAGLVWREKYELGAVFISAQQFRE